jgi:phosphoribosyl 1,2-cyclic phosphodiesterase
MGFSVRFWGVRGSIACPSPRHVGYGGNTACLQVMAGDQLLILDAGTGIRRLGHQLEREGLRFFHLLLTHTHWDHINGFPFFRPGYSSSNTLHVRAGHLHHSGGVRDVLAGQMMQPTFPVPLETMRADLQFEDFEAGDTFRLDGGIVVRTAPLNHPNGATGYRFDYMGKSLCYITDTEHVIGTLDQKILDLIEGADLVIYDSTYTDDEFPTFRGWGHSTWQEGVRLCHAAHARRLAIFHHDPDHEDDFMLRVELEARESWSEAFVAREGDHITLV